METWLAWCRPEALLMVVVWTVVAIVALGWACAGATSGSSLDRPWAPNPRLY